MRFTIAATAAFVAGAAATYKRPSEYETPEYTTEVVKDYTTYCSKATSLVHGGKTYTVTEPSYVTITDCDCTITKPVAVTTTPVAATTTEAPLSDYYTATEGYEHETETIATLPTLSEAYSDYYTSPAAASSTEKPVASSYTKPEASSYTKPATHVEVPETHVAVPTTKVAVPTTVAPVYPTHVATYPVVNSTVALSTGATTVKASVSATSPGAPVFTGAASKVAGGSALAAILGLAALAL